MATKKIPTDWSVDTGDFDAVGVKGDYDRYFGLTINVINETLNSADIPIGAIITSVKLTATVRAQNKTTSIGSIPKLKITFGTSSGANSNVLLETVNIGSNTKDASITRTIDLSSVIGNNGQSPFQLNTSKGDYVVYNVWLNNYGIKRYQLYDFYFDVTYEIPTYTLTVQSNNASYGTVTGGGTYENQATATLTATPNTGYRFVGWSDDANAPATRTVTVAGDATYTAIFEPNTCTIIAQPNNTAYGTVTGSGTYDIGSKATLTATANEGYKFVKWGNGSTNATMTPTIAVSETYIAIFEPITYYVAFDDNGATSGSVETLTVKYGETFYLPENGFTKQVTITWETNADGASVEYYKNSQNCPFNGWKVGSETESPGTGFSNYTTTDGQTITFSAEWDYCLFTHPTATRKSYKLKEWNTKADGSGQTYPISQFYSQTTLTLYAQWERSACTITTQASPSGGGTVTGGGTYDIGTEITLIAIPSDGYQFKYWIDDDGVQIWQNEVTMDAVEDYALTAYFRVNRMHLGTAQPKEMYIGETPIKEIYLGTTKIYEQ